MCLIFVHVEILFLSFFQLYFELWYFICFGVDSGFRPFGVSLLVTGFDDKGPQLYQVCQYKLYLIRLGTFIATAFKPWSPFDISLHFVSKHCLLYCILTFIWTPFAIIQFIYWLCCVDLKDKSQEKILKLA